MSSFNEILSEFTSSITQSLMTFQKIKPIHSSNNAIQKSIFSSFFNERTLDIIWRESYNVRYIEIQIISTRVKTM